MKASSSSKLIYTLLLFLLTGCVSTEETTQLSQASPPIHWQEQASSDTLMNTAPGDLQDLTHQPEVRKFLISTLKSNPDLTQTALLLKEQGLLTENTRAASAPELNLSLGRQRFEEQNILSNSNTLGFNLAWEVDIWNRIAKETSQSDLQTHAIQQDLQAAHNSLAARLLQHWIDISLRQQIINTESNWLESVRANESVIQSRYQRGVGTLADLEAVRSSSSRLQANLLARIQIQKEAFRALAELQGVSQAQLSLPTSQIPVIDKPPIHLPAQVLAHRPDVKAAYLRIESNKAGTAVAQKRLLPSFSLSGSLNQTTPNFHDLLKASSAWNLLGQLTAPLFNGGRLKRDIEIAKLTTERSYLSYQQTVVTALNEVENAISREQSLSLQLTAFKKAQLHARNNLTHYRSRYQQGLSDILELLNAQQSLYEARIQFLETTQLHLSNRISLALALGMGVKNDDII